MHIKQKIHYLKKTNFTTEYLTNIYQFRPKAQSEIATDHYIDEYSHAPVWLPVDWANNQE